MRWFRRVAPLLTLTLLAAAQGPKVQAVLFFSPTCPHCHRVINDVLPAVFASYGGGAKLRYDESLPEDSLCFYELANDRLQLLLVDVTIPPGGELYEAATVRFRVPAERMGVPRLVVGETVLVGSDEIPQQFPRLIEGGLAQGGIDWPQIPGLDEALAFFEPNLGTQSGALSPSLLDNLARDPIGNSLSLVVLTGMVLSLVGVGLRLRLRPNPPTPTPAPWTVPALAIVGITVAGYLTYVGASGGSAVCGPVGDCNAVQQSDYARLFGVPNGALGLIAYLAVLALWPLSRRAPVGGSNLAAVLLFALTALGTLFSTYLTTLEPFVIGATCIWCLTSAVVMTALMWLTSGPANQAWKALRAPGGAA